MMLRSATVFLLASSSALAQVGAGTPPSTPGTSLGSGVPNPRTDRPPVACDKLKAEDREKCARIRGPVTPESAGAGSTGMGSGPAAGSGTTGPGTGTAPGLPGR
jgi:hypothetical protein